MALETLAYPQELTTGLAILLVGMYSLIGFIAVRLYSPISIAGWGISIIAFIFTILVDIQFVIVWVTLIIAVILEMISITVYATFGTKT